MRTRGWPLMPAVYRVPLISAKGERRLPLTPLITDSAGLAGRAREHRWIKADFLTGPASLDKYKVVLAKANGSGAFGEVLSSPVVSGPGVGIGTSTNGKPIGSPGSGLGSPENPVDARKLR